VSSSGLTRQFFERDVLVCARDLIGCMLRWEECEGIVVETEAYAATGDQACHSFSRASTREFIGRNPPGTAYVFFNYGVHWMLNVLVKGDGEDGIVLIRAVQPTGGIELMRRRRGQKALEALCSGPGKLTQAMAVAGIHHQIDLCGGRTGFHAAPAPVEVETDVRIGISRATHLPWRFLAKDSPFVSVPAGRRKPTGKTVKNRG